MWKCTGCDWTGDELVPTTVPAGIQGNVKTSACPECGLTVGGGVVMFEVKPKPPAEEIPTEDKPVFLCRYCDKECGSWIGRNSHEKACSENPENM